MQLVITRGLVLDARTRAARAEVRSVLGDLREAADGDGPPSIVVDRGHGVVIDAEGRLTLGSDRAGELLWAACAAAALRCGRLPLHGATATMPDSRVVTIVGGSGTGKSTALLAARGMGARVVAPEWVLVDADGSVAPLPGRLRLRSHHLTGATAWDERLPLPVALRMLAARRLEPVARRSERVRRAVDHRAYVDVALPSPPPRLDSLDVVLMLEAAGVDAPAVSTISAAAAVSRLTTLIRDDLTVLRSVGSRSEAVAQLDAVTGASLDALVGDRLERTRPQLVGISHDHPRSGRHFAETVAAVLR